MNREPFAFDHSRPCKLEDLDPKIQPFVQFLWDNGYKTFTSCQGGEGHAFSRPTIGLEYIFKKGDDYFEFRDKLIALISNSPLFEDIIFNVTLKFSMSKLRKMHWEYPYLEFPHLEL